MRYLVLLFAFLTVFIARAQSPCESLYINQIYLNPLNTDLFMVEVINESSEIFSYPSFHIMDGSDTVGVEMVNYFGIGSGPQEHAVSNTLGPIQPGESFDWTVELWTGFDDSLFCQWESTWTPYEEESCTELQAVVAFTEVGNLGAYLQVFDEDGVFFLDTIIMNTGTSDLYHFLPFCAPEGCYDVQISPIGSPIFDMNVHALVSLQNSSWNFSENGVTASAGSPFDAFDFTVYYGCPSSLAEIVAPIPFALHGNRIQHQGKERMTIQVYDLKGSLLISEQVGVGSTLQVPHEGLVIISWQMAGESGSETYFLPFD